MNERTFSHLFVAGAVFLLYFLPTVLLSAYSLTMLPLQHRWSLFSVGLLLASSGSIAFYLLLERRPRQPPAPPEPLAVPEPEPSIDNELELLQQTLDEAKEREELLDQRLQEAEKEKQTLHNECEQERRKKEKLAEEFSFYKEKSQQAMEEERRLFDEREETITHLRLAVEQKQQESEALQNKIHDLTYEIKTLLQLADMDHSLGLTVKETAQEYQVQVNEVPSFAAVPMYDEPYSEEKAGAQLKRCINIAQKITSSHHFGGYSSRFRDLSLDNDALDLRRLCDNLCSESGNTILVYSQKQRRVLFVNKEVSNLLGWNEEKFIQNFESIIQEGQEAWKNAIAQLNNVTHNHTRLLMKTRSGYDELIECEMGLIPTGVFRNNLIAILYR